MAPISPPFWDECSKIKVEIPVLQRERISGRLGREHGVLPFGLPKRSVIWV